MADIINLADNTDAIGRGLEQAASGVGSAIGDLLIWAAIIILLGVFLWFVLWWNSFRFRIKIKEVISSDGHFYIIEDRAKRKFKDGAEFWRLRRRRATIPAPPREALQIGWKGRYYAECAHHEKSGRDAGYNWIIPNKDPFSGDYAVSQTQEERALLADRLRRANERKSRSTLDIIMHFAGMTFVLIFVISLMVFWGELTSSVTSAADEVQASLQRQQEITSAQADLMRQMNNVFASMECKVVPGGSVDLPLDGSGGAS